MSKICRRPDCRTVNPDSAIFCRKCGLALEDDKTEEASTITQSSSPSSQKTDCRPFYMRHPEYHLKPFSEFPELTFWFNKPDYVEDRDETEMPDFLFIVKDEKFGILHWETETVKHLFKKDTYVEHYNRIIQCEYAKIEKEEDHFVCYKDDGSCVYIDLKGNVLK